MSYQVVFVLNFFAVYFLMKITSLMTSPFKGQVSSIEFLLLSPFLSVRSLRSPNLRKDYLCIVRLIVSLALTEVMINLANHYLHPFTYWKAILLAPLIYVLTHAINAFAQVVE